MAAESAALSSTASSTAPVSNGRLLRREDDGSAARLRGDVSSEGEGASADCSSRTERGSSSSHGGEIAAEIAAEDCSSRTERGSSSSHGGGSAIVLTSLASKLDSARRGAPWGATAESPTSRGAKASVSSWTASGWAAPGWHVTRTASAPGRDTRASSAAVCELHTSACEMRAGGGTGDTMGGGGAGTTANIRDMIAAA